MKPIHIILLAALVMASVHSVAAWAQPPGGGNEPPRLTLEQAVRTAMEKHPLLQSSEFAVQSAEARVKQAQSSYYPHVGGSAVQTNGTLRTNALFRPSGTLIEPKYLPSAHSTTRLMTDLPHRDRPTSTPSATVGCASIVPRGVLTNAQTTL